MYNKDWTQMGRTDFSWEAIETTIVMEWTPTTLNGIKVPK